MFSTVLRKQDIFLQIGHTVLPDVSDRKNEGIREGSLPRKEQFMPSTRSIVPASARAAPAPCRPRCPLGQRASDTNVP